MTIALFEPTGHRSTFPQSAWSWSSKYAGTKQLSETKVGSMSLCVALCELSPACDGATWSKDNHNCVTTRGPGQIVNATEHKIAFVKPLVCKAGDWGKRLSASPPECHSTTPSRCLAASLSLCHSIMLLSATVSLYLAASLPLCHSVLLSLCPSAIYGSATC